MAETKSRPLSPVRLRIYNSLARDGRRTVIDFEELIAYCEVSQPAITQTLDGHRRNPDLQDKIADFYGLDPAELWGAWYGRPTAAVA